MEGPVELVKTVEELREIYEILIDSEDHIKQSKEYSWKHLVNFLTYCIVTQDEKDEDNPHKPLPMAQKPHLLELARIWHKDKTPMTIVKSRQLMVTWLFSATMLWDAMFKKGRLNIIISKKEDDADKTINRIKLMYSNLPEMFHKAFPVNNTPQGELGAYCKLEFKNNGSRIWGLSSNPEHIRQNTASNIFFDEMAFFQEARKCYTAAMPSIRGGGKFIGCSTPNGRNFFHDLVTDKV